jgi:hypothetical protein
VILSVPSHRKQPLCFTKRTDLEGENVNVIIELEQNRIRLGTETGEVLRIMAALLPVTMAARPEA